jgi:hypothetical protein
MEGFLTNAFERERNGNLKRFPLQKSQHTYQRGRSWETALHDLFNRIEVALHHRIFACGTFLDVEGAFDKLHEKSNYKG